MSYSTIIRTLRDGSLKIRDGAMTPKVCTVLCDDGNFQWSERNDIREQRCRGRLYGTRFGDEQPTQLQCTFKWAQLIQYTELSTDPIVPYEIIDNVGDGFVSTDTNHEYALEWEFRVSDPNGDSDNDEIITFGIVVKEELTCAEADEYNTIQFTGRDYAIAPTIVRG